MKRKIGLDNLVFYFLKVSLRLVIKVKPTSPVPKSKIAAGSGTGDVPTFGNVPSAVNVAEL